MEPTPRNRTTEYVDRRSEADRRRDMNATLERIIRLSYEPGRDGHLIRCWMSAVTNSPAVGASAGCAAVDELQSRRSHSERERTGRPRATAHSATLKSTAPYRKPWIANPGNGNPLAQVPRLMNAERRVLVHALFDSLDLRGMSSLLRTTGPYGAADDPYPYVRVSPKRAPQAGEPTSSGSEPCGGTSPEA